VAVSQILPHGSIPITTICAAQLMITEIALAAPNGGPEPPVLRITLVACKRAAGRTYRRLRVRSPRPPSSLSVMPEWEMNVPGSRGGRLRRGVPGHGSLPGFPVR